MIANVSAFSLIFKWTFTAFVFCQPVHAALWKFAFSFIFSFIQQTFVQWSPSPCQALCWGSSSKVSTLHFLHISPSSGAHHEQGKIAARRREQVLGDRSQCRILWEQRDNLQFGIYKILFKCLISVWCKRQKSGQVWILRLWNNVSKKTLRAWKKIDKVCRKGKRNQIRIIILESSLVAQQVKDPVLSRQWLGLNPWPRNFCMPWVWPKEKKTKPKPKTSPRIIIFTWCHLFSS